MTRNNTWVLFSPPDIAIAPRPNQTILFVIQLNRNPLDRLTNLLWPKIVDVRLHHRLISSQKSSSWAKWFNSFQTCITCSQIASPSKQISVSLLGINTLKSECGFIPDLKSSRASKDYFQWFRARMISLPISWYWPPSTHNVGRILNCQKYMDTDILAWGMKNENLIPNHTKCASNCTSWLTYHHQYF